MAQLPPKREYVLYAPLTKEQKELYQALLERRGKSWLVEKLLGAKKEQSTAASVRKRKRALNKQSSLVQEQEDTKEPLQKKQYFVHPPADQSKELPPARKHPARKHKRNDYRELEEGEWLDKLDEETLYQDCVRDEDTDVDPMAADYERLLIQATKEVSGKKLQNLIMQLRLCCNSPHHFYWPWTPVDTVLPDQTLIISSGKLLLLDRLLPVLFAGGHKVLIFSQFTSTLDILNDYASTLRGWLCARIDGSVKLSERREQIQQFNDNPEWKIFLLSTRAGGQGINLTAADTVILFDSDWNPMMDLQAQDRAHRIGQTKPVIVFRLATGGTVEERLLERAEGKRRLERLVMMKGKFGGMVGEGGVMMEEGGVVKDENLPPGEVTVDKKDAAGGWGEKDLEGILMREESEKVKVMEDGDVLLSDEDMEVLMDRSPEAYERAARGEEKSVLGREALKITE